MTAPTCRYCGDTGEIKMLRGGQDGPAQETSVRCTHRVPFHQANPDFTPPTEQDPDVND